MKQMVYAPGSQHRLQHIHEGRAPVFHARTVELDDGVFSVYVTDHSGQAVAFAVQQTISGGVGGYHPVPQAGGLFHPPGEERLVDRLVLRGPYPDGDGSSFGDSAGHEPAPGIRYRHDLPRLERRILERIPEDPGMTLLQGPGQRLAQPDPVFFCRRR
jgi:hypothetical protein